MGKREMIERTRRGLEEFSRLSPDEQVRRMISYGTVNEKGEVLVNGDEVASESGSAPVQDQAFSRPQVQQRGQDGLIPGSQVGR
jgi:hypothetical protein